MKEEKKEENSEELRHMQDALEKGDLAQVLVDKAMDSLNIDWDSITEESLLTGFKDSTEKMAENIRIISKPDNPLKGFDQYMKMFKKTYTPSTENIANLHLAMNIHIKAGKKNGNEKDTNIYDSYRDKYHPSIWQRIKKLFS